MSELLKELNYWRAERPDEWKMDEIIKLAEQLQDKNDRLSAVLKELIDGIHNKFYMYPTVSEPIIRKAINTLENTEDNYE